MLEVHCIYCIFTKIRFTLSHMTLITDGAGILAKNLKHIKVQLKQYTVNLSYLAGKIFGGRWFFSRLACILSSTLLNIPIYLRNMFGIWCCTWLRKSRIISAPPPPNKKKSRFLILKIYLCQKYKFWLPRILIFCKTQPLTRV